MEAVNALMTKRASRANLDTSKSYIKVQNVGGKRVEEEVGKFIKAYRMGSGDGMTLHWEFLKGGQVIRVDDEMWGSVGGQELVGFVEKD
jgi:hypothetical protein